MNYWDLETDRLKRKDTSKEIGWEGDITDIFGVTVSKTILAIWIANL